MASLGYELKQAREAKGVSLTQLAENTRIGIRFLQAIESDDFKSLPGGLFNRSFIKAYARAVGIDEDEAVVAYQKQTGDGPANSDAQLNNIPTYTVPREEEVNFVPYIIGAVVAVVLFLGCWALYRHFNAPGQQTSQPPTAPAPAPSTPTTPTTVPPVLSGGAPPPAPAPTTATPPTSAPLVLELVAANDDCYVKVDPDGKIEKGLVLKMGQNQTFEATEQMLVRVGKVASVTAKLNGKEITLESPTGNREDFKISLKDGQPAIERIKRFIPKNKPAATGEAPTGTPPATTGGTGNPQ